MDHCIRRPGIQSTRRVVQRQTSPLPAKLPTPHYLHFRRCHGQTIGSQVQNARGSRRCADLVYALSKVRANGP